MMRTVLLLVLLAPLPLGAAGEPTHKVRYEFALLHEGPGYGTKITGELEAGSRVRVDREEGEWAHVEGKGWVLAGFLEPLGVEAVSTGPAPPAEPPVPEREAAPGPAGPSPEESPPEPGTGELREVQEALEVSRRSEQALRGEIGRLQEDLASLRVKLQAFEEEAARRKGAGEEEAALRQDLARERERAEAAEGRLEKEVEIAREEARAETDSRWRAEMEKKETEWEARLRRDLQAARDQAELDREKAVRLAREEEHTRIETYLDEMSDLRKIQVVEDRQAAEEETKTMHEAALRKQRLLFEREKREALEDLEKRLRKEHDTTLIKAMAGMEEEFRNRLERIRTEERGRCEQSLAVLREIIEPGEEEETKPDPEAMALAVRREERDRCEAELEGQRSLLEEERRRAVMLARDEALAERPPPAESAKPDCSAETRRCEAAMELLRSDMEARRQREVDRAVAQALRQERRRETEERIAGREAIAAPATDPSLAEVACRESIRRELERARAEWQAETARYVELAVERARARWEAGEE